ncbi:hypothetical protein BX666DRAFT_1995588 [Dichotomocladium elegans]|nr:hypothetical protein BX666DRAFT_1995588 [Dichotomocladium elegans]
MVQHANDNPPLQEFYGFKILPVLVGDNCRHYIYMRKHEARSEHEAGADRTLFVANLPVDTTLESVQDLFKPYGEVIYLQLPGDPPYQETSTSRRANKRKTREEKTVKQAWKHLLHTGTIGHVVFKTANQLEQVLQMPMEEDKRWKSGISAEQPLGYKRYLLRYMKSRPNPEKLQQEVDTFMKKFKAHEYERERAEKEKKDKMDEDGFVTVVRTKRLQAEPQQVVVKQASQYSDFYRFQMREKKHNGTAMNGR